MDAPNKRVLTDEVREAVLSSDQFSRSSSSGTPEDLVQRLRSVGARGRKSVLEGYKTAPSSFTKSQSTGTVIFKSMKDTLQEVYASGNASVAPAIGNDISRKRSLSISDQGGCDTVPQDCDMIPEDNELGGELSSRVIANPIISRPMKPLRTSRRSLFETQSLPSGSFAFGVSGQNLAAQSTAGINNEEDWSEEATLQSSDQPFEPMVL
ncbi:hypothetical protein GALMADRAFT_236111 [Galerina marginata CBS 339.88]|uniref:Uncharacterized protein n=1 Tax=Galerina marginata (strain CBS 339.88) TaxID=685588 RepID=A0A067TKI5_GALM3|nr:hypothetical protein GALMADRAFT_236111 [Galerina marginata CBS 339.88]